MKIVEIKVHVRLQNKLQKELIYEMCLCNGTSVSISNSDCGFSQKINLNDFYGSSSYLKKIIVSNKGIIFK